MLEYRKRPLGRFTAMNIPIVYTKLRGIVANIYYHIGLQKKEQHKGRKLKIKIIDILTLGLYQHQSGRNTKKSLWNDFKESLNCSYKTLVVNLNRFSKMALLILYFILKQNRKNSHIIKHTDSTDIPVCLNKNANKHKTMKMLSSWGHSGKGSYYGLKMNMTTDLNRHILALRFTSADKDDRETFYEMNVDLNGIFVADAGYVSKDLEQKFYQENQRIVFIKPRSNMKKIITALEYHLYNTRFQIEFNFRNLKLFHGLITSLPKSVNGYIANYIYSLLSFVLV